MVHLVCYSCEMVHEEQSSLMKDRSTNSQDMKMAQYRNLNHWKPTWVKNVAFPNTFSSLFCFKTNTYCLFFPQISSWFSNFCFIVAQKEMSSRSQGSLIYIIKLTEEVLGNLTKVASFPCLLLFLLFFIEKPLTLSSVFKAKGHPLFLLCELNLLSIVKGFLLFLCS